MAAAIQPPVPIIRFIREGCENDLEAVPENVRQYTYKSYLQQNMAILVSDMSGFTRLTRKYGIIHFASIIARIRQLFLPYFHKNGAMVITTEADSFNVLFPSVSAAVKAALCMQRLTTMYNASLPPERAHYTLPLEGVGIDFGPGVLLDQSGKLLGDTFTNAHELGEELCKGNMIAVSSSARAEIEKSPEFQGAVFTPLSAPPDSAEVAQALNDMGGAFELCLQSIEKACGEILTVGIDDDRYMQDELIEFARRHDATMTPSELTRLDAVLREKYMTERVSLMFTISFENTSDPREALRLKFECLTALSGAFSRHNAVAVEDVLYFFSNPGDAVLCALECRKIMRELSEQQLDKTVPRSFIRGYGIHMGDVLVVDGSDIHWGDPVNTSSKLGQEIAANEEVIISEATFEASRSDPRLRGLHFDQVDVTISGVEMHPYKIYHEAPDDAREQGAVAAPIELESLRSSILDKFNNSGLVNDTAIDRKVLHRLLKALDPQFLDADFEAIINHIGRGDASNISLPAFLDWALDSSRGS